MDEKGIWHVSIRRELHGCYCCEKVTMVLVVGFSLDRSLAIVMLGFVAKPNVCSMGWVIR